MVMVHGYGMRCAHGYGSWLWHEMCSWFGMTVCDIGEWATMNGAH